MAPTKQEQVTEVTEQVPLDGKKALSISHEDYSKSLHKDFLPTWGKQVFPPLEFFEHKDRGTFADPKLSNLLPKGGDFTTSDITPKLGTEVEGVQLSKLDDKGKDELALLAAKRGLLVFRNQDIAQYGPKFFSDYGKYYGPLHVHPVSGAPEGHPELHIVYATKDFSQKFFSLETKTSSVAWHTDISYELQPPGITFFSVLEGPESGGDTVFTDTVEAYNRLSPEFQKRLDGLYVEHSSLEQAQHGAARGTTARRAPVKNIHPLVRVHPVTGDKILYVNRAFSRRIVGLKDQESDALLEFLYRHIESGHDFQARANWLPGTVVIWDNRRVQHTAIYDWDSNTATRHAVRVTPQAERPIADVKDLNKRDENRVVGE